MDIHDHSWTTALRVAEKWKEEAKARGDILVFKAKDMQSIMGLSDYEYSQAIFAWDSSYNYGRLDGFYIGCDSYTVLYLVPEKGIRDVFNNRDELEIFDDFKTGPFVREEAV